MATDEKKGLTPVSSRDHHEHDEYSEGDDGIAKQNAIADADAANVPTRRQIGLFSAVFIIFNRIIGTGYVVSSPLSILMLILALQCVRDTERHSRTKWKCWDVTVRWRIVFFLGRSLTVSFRFMWVIGSIIAAAGMWVYVVWGTVSSNHIQFLPTLTCYR